MGKHTELLAQIAAMDESDWEELFLLYPELHERYRKIFSSPAKVPDAVMRALDRMSTPLHDSRLSGLTAELDAANIKTIRDYVLSGTSPAKVGGDEREALSDDEAALLASIKQFHTHDFGRGPELHADAIADAYKKGRAALSADGGDVAKHIAFLTSETDRLREALAYWQNRTSELADGGDLKAEQVEWVVNDIAELGVKIGSKFFWLYKGTSLVYEEATHDDGSPMHWRHVFTREFGEVVHPINYANPELIGTVSLDDSEDWALLPAALDAKAKGDA